MPKDGIYTVRVELVQPGDGSYEIGLGYANRPNPADITPTPLPLRVGVPTPSPSYAGLGSFVRELSIGENIGGILSENVPRHIYTLTGEEGQIINAEMQRVSGSIDPILAIYTPDGDPIAMDDNSGGNRSALLRNIRLPEDGLYSIQVSGDGFAGNYSLLVTQGRVEIQAQGAAEPTLTATPLLVTPTPWSRHPRRTLARPCACARTHR